jgi:hypothetical protein
MHENAAAVELETDAMVPDEPASEGAVQEGVTQEGAARKGATQEGALQQEAIPENHNRETVNLDFIQAHNNSSKKTPEHIVNIHALTATKNEHGFHTFSFKKGKSVVLGSSTIAGAGIGLFNGAKVKKERSFVTTFQGKRYHDEAAAKDSGSDSIFYEAEENIYIVGDKKKSYGPWINDPLDAMKTNCQLKFNKKNHKFEIRVLETDIEPYAELFIAYGSDYWRKHLDKAPIEKIIASYPADIQQIDRRIFVVHPTSSNKY